ncbi:TetR/AcrR family transcriptional regulator [Williamsia maris]|uniref:Transcriptional regulator, TetR family n=1 Tax=Williamsia maris TaxID=72806 RepID=A0ABT1H9X4_9NOCA|nr:TetR/AcrR family transcriptional regulator [Williamsia maris]MCP2175056.1 transcriptional regulator, TetR family [Williamsia maris]
MTVTEQSETREVIIACSQVLMARKGYTAVGLNEILTAAHVPKGSFYYHFASKDALGEAMLRSYFEGYLADFDEILSRDDHTWAERIGLYFASWIESQSSFDCQGKCLAVKLGAEVADLSESMRVALRDGIGEITNRIERAIRAGLDDGSVSSPGDPAATASALYELWLGASVVAKVNRSTTSMDSALAHTRTVLGI